MKLIISHDVDILHADDHLKDLLMVKRIARNFIELLLGYASTLEVFHRVADICNNRIHRLPELISFDLENSIPSTFFFGMANGMYLNYSLERAAFWINKVQEAGLAVGVHGVEYDNPAAINREFDTFEPMTAGNNFGIRMHYLRMNGDTLINLEKAGYAFDSSVETLKAPYKVGRMWEFPLHIMDGSIFYRGRRWINTTFEQARQITLDMFAQAEAQGIPYFTILLHDPYFSPAYRHIYNWYRWVIQYAGENGLEFIDYRGAVEELETL
jgi:hypothetical protein